MSMPLPLKMSAPAWPFEPISCFGETDEHVVIGVAGQQVGERGARHLLHGLVDVVRARWPVCRVAVVRAGPDRRHNPGRGVIGR